MCLVWQSHFTYHPGPCILGTELWPVAAVFQLKYIRFMWEDIKKKQKQKQKKQPSKLHVPSFIS